MGTKNSNTSQELFNLNGKPSFGQALPLAFQHVVAMIIGCVAPAIILAGVSGLSESDTVVLIQASLAMSAISTFIQLFPFIKFKSYQIGAGLPVIMGISFAYVPIMQSIAQDADVGTILGAQIVGGIVAIIVGIFIKQIRHLFPPLVTGTVVFAIGLSLYPTAVNYMAGGAGGAQIIGGIVAFVMGILVKKIRVFFPPLITGTVVFTIGLSLYPTAINYMAGGTSNPDYGSWQNWLVAIITLVVVTGLNHFGKGFLKLSSVLIGIIVGYVVALGFGMVDFSSVLTAKWVQFPQPMHFGIKFEPSSCVAIAVLFAISSIQAIGDFSATTTGGMDRMPTDEELSGGIIGYGVSNIVCAFFSGLPTATYSQNVGIVSSTKVVAKRVFGIAAMIMLVAGIMPKIAYILLTIPSCVLGGATISVFAMISMTGIKLINNSKMNYRNTSIVGLAIALGMGVTQANAALAQLPAWVTTIFGKSPVALSTLVAVFLNLVLPKEKEE